MTDQRPTEHIDPDILLARQFRDEANAATEEARIEKVEVLLPIWERMRWRRVHNGLGEEYDLSLTPRGYSA